MKEKTPGQIAYEAHVEWLGYPTGKMRRETASPADKAKFEFIGQAVASAVCPVPDPGGTG